MSTTRIIGLGNLFAGDDAAGIQVVRKLQTFGIPGLEVLEAGMAGLTLLDWLEGAKLAIVVDAVHGTQEEGTIIRLEIPRDLEQITRFSWDSATSSTHTMGLSEVMALGATLGTLPPHLSIIGIELGHVSTDEPLSSKVLKATERVAKILEKELETLACTNFN